MEDLVFKPSPQSTQVCHLTNTITAPIPARNSTSCTLLQSILTHHLSSIQQQTLATAAEVPWYTVPAAEELARSKCATLVHPAYVQCAPRAQMRSSRNSLAAGCLVALSVMPWTAPTNHSSSSLGSIGKRRKLSNMSQAFPGHIGVHLHDRQLK